MDQLLTNSELLRFSMAFLSAVCNAVLSLIIGNQVFIFAFINIQIKAPARVSVHFFFFSKVGFWLYDGFTGELGFI